MSDKIFDYRDYVDTSRLMEANRGEDIRNTLAELSQIPEFQNVLKSAYAQEGGKMTLTNVTDVGNQVATNDSNPLIPKGAVNIDINTSALTHYKILDQNRYEPLSLQHALTHEFIHKSDPEIQEENIEAVRSSGKTQDEIERSFEQNAVNRTNAILSKYYQEPNRGEYGDTYTLATSDQPLIIRPLASAREELLPSRGTAATECAIESVKTPAPPNPMLACMANLSKDELALFDRARFMLDGKSSEASLSTQQEAGRQATPQDAIVVSQNGRDY